MNKQQKEEMDALDHISDAAKMILFIMLAMMLFWLAIFLLVAIFF